MVRVNFWGGAAMGVILGVADIVGEELGYWDGWVFGLFAMAG